MNAETYKVRKKQLIKTICTFPNMPVGLGKTTSNLCHDRKPSAKKRLDVRNSNYVLAINKREGWIEVERMTQYEDLAAALEQG